MSATQNEEQNRKDAAYPYYDLESSIQLSAHIKELGGSKGSVKKSILARKIGLAESTPSFFQKLSAAKTFGIIDGRGDYSLTELGKIYFFPQSDGAASAALLEMLSHPTIFQTVISKFDGETLPKTDLLGNIFHDLGVPESWKDRVAQIFAKSALYVGIIDSNGFLRYDAAVHSAPTENSERPSSEKPEAQARISDSVVAPAKKTVTTPAGYYSAPESKEVWASGPIRVETPLNISPELWARLNAYVQVLNPSPSVGRILNDENLILDVLNDLNGLGKSEGQISDATTLPIGKVSEVLGRRPEMFVRGADFLWRKKGP